MPRELQILDHNTLTLYDPVEKTTVVFTYRTPSTDDRIRHMAGRYKRQGTKLIDCSRTRTIDSAVSVLTGIRPEDFAFAGKPLSSTPGENGYREDWKDLVKASAGDLLFLMGYELFEGRISLPNDAKLDIVSELDVQGSTVEADDDRLKEDIPPLAKSSGD
ncbi:MAG: hypothetical protein ABSA86_13165 [Oryzomonas sp.]|jgi:hypothetical protein